MPGLRGFTLAELLLALVILGVIATFTIPKVLQSQASEKKKAVFRESIASVVDILNQGVKTGALQANASNKGQYFLDRLNAIKVCSSDAAVQGCWNLAVQGSISGEENDPGVMLANGAVIIGLNNNGTIAYNAWAVDWNGVDGPNTIGDDQLWMRMCWGPGNCTTQYAGSGANAPGSIGPHSGGSAANTALYQTLFQN